MNITRAAPLADQVDRIIRSRFRDGTYAPGDRMPSETELSREFTVSRATIRTVFARLEAEGLILRKQGDGTYVNAHIQDVNTHLGGLWEFSQLIRYSGFEASIEPLSIELRKANAEEAAALDLGPGSDVVTMQRLFYADDQPAILATNTLSRDLVAMPLDKLDGQLSLHEFLQTFCQREIAYAVSDVSAERIGRANAPYFDVSRGTPFLRIKITFYDKENQPITYGSSLFNDTVLKLRLVQAWL